LFRRRAPQRLHLCRLVRASRARHLPQALELITREGAAEVTPLAGSTRLRLQERPMLGRFQAFCYHPLFQMARHCDDGLGDGAIVRSG